MMDDFLMNFSWEEVEEWSIEDIEMDYLMRSIEDGED